MNYRIRPLDSRSEPEIQWVALRMRDTLVEVLGLEQGFSMYSLDWLRDRVCQHLDPARLNGEVFVVEDESGQIAGHTMVRPDLDGCDLLGLFSTVYVEPAARRKSLAQQLLVQGESWMRSRALPQAATYTAQSNTPLHKLFQSHGYRMEPQSHGFVKLTRRL